jgi:hypothetical protein
MQRDKRIVSHAVLCVFSLPAAFAWYLVTFLPGGAAGLRVLSGVLWKLVGGAVTACSRGAVCCIRAIIKA